MSNLLTFTASLIALTANAPPPAVGDASVAAGATTITVTIPRSFDELQVIDHWNLRYVNFKEHPLADQVAQVKANLDTAAKLGFTSYLLFAKDTFQHLVSWNGRAEPDRVLREALRDILAHAQRRGMALYFHSNEFMWPANIGVPYKDTPEAWDAYRGAVTEFVKLFPSIAGLEVTGDETKACNGPRPR